MKSALLLLFLLLSLFLTAQSLPFTFEETITTANFVNFDGGTAEVIDNPQINGINTSSKVAQIVRDGGMIWAGSKVSLSTNLDFTTNSILTMKVFTTAPVGTIVKFKLEGDGQAERDVVTTVSGEWEQLSWDFTGEPQNYKDVVFMFDFGNVGDGSVHSTFLFDDVEQLFGGSQIDLPVDFEGSEINYTMSDFGGNVSSLVDDPTIGGNKVIQVIKTYEAATWAGTTIGTPAGFMTDVPLTLTDSKMSVKVWSPEAGTPIRLKVEDSKDPTHTCETETNSTLDGGWEIITFDFLNQAPGTELLSIGLDKGWTYNMASIFFNFGTEGATAGEKTYYFDDVKFGEQVLGFTDREVNKITVFPNPSRSTFRIASEEAIIERLEVYDSHGCRLLATETSSSIIDLANNEWLPGTYTARVSTKLGVEILRLVKL